MAKYCEEIFGELLLKQPVENFPVKHASLLLHDMRRAGFDGTCSNAVSCSVFADGVGAPPAVSQ